MVLGARIFAPTIREAMRSGVVKGKVTRMDLGLDDLENAGIEF